MYRASPTEPRRGWYGFCGGVSSRRPAALKAFAVRGPSHSTEPGEDMLVVGRMGAEALKLRFRERAPLL